MSYLHNGPMIFIFIGFLNPNAKLLTGSTEPAAVRESGSACLGVPHME